MIEIDRLTVRFGGVVAINELSVVLNASITGLIGPNGAGKTTLLNALSGFVRPASGRIRVNGSEARHLALHRRTAFGIRRTFQTVLVIDNLSIWDNVVSVVDNLPVDRRHRDSLVQSVLEYVGLTEQTHRHAGQLNAFERRTLELARALVGAPKLIMMDEPAAGLNDAESLRLRRIIKTIPEYSNAKVLLVDHDVDLIAAICSETLVLDLGNQLAHGPTAEVLKSERVREAYLGVPPESSE